MQNPKQNTLLKKTEKVGRISRTKENAIMYILVLNKGNIPVTNSGNVKTTTAVSNGITM